MVAILLTNRSGYPVGHADALPAKHGQADGVQADYTYSARGEVEGKAKRGQSNVS